MPESREGCSDGHIEFIRSLPPACDGPACRSGCIASEPLTLSAMQRAVASVCIPTCTVKMRTNHVAFGFGGTSSEIYSGGSFDGRIACDLGAGLIINPEFAGENRGNRIFSSRAFPRTDLRVSDFVADRYSCLSSMWQVTAAVVLMTVWAPAATTPSVWRTGSPTFPV